MRKTLVFFLGVLAGASALFVFNALSRHFVEKQNLSDSCKDSLPSVPSLSDKKVSKEVLLTSHTYWGNGHPFIMLWTTSAAIGRYTDDPGADVDVPVDEVSVALRTDGKKITTVNFIDPEDSEYYRCRSAVILVPDNWQLDYWQGVLSNIRADYHEYFKKAPR